MKNIIRKYPETFLVILALIFIGGIIGCYSWGVGLVVTELNRAGNSNADTSQNVGFNLQDAQNLQLPGLVNQ